LPLRQSVLLTSRQRDGSAVPSLASEHLQELNLFSGEEERQLAEEVLKNTLGSMFQGEFNAYSADTRYLRRASAGSDTVHTLSNPLSVNGSCLMRYFQTVSSLSSLFLALVLYPEVQKRAQAELDSVVSRDRMPTYDDKPRLPYIEAISKELLRWQMVTPMGADANARFRVSAH
jgi:hypothetical protein